MKLFSRTMAVASLAALGTLTTVPAMASTGLATPTQCSITTSGSIASSNCLGGTGEHRIVCLFIHHIPGVGIIESYGPWKPVGATSSTYCPSDRVTGTRVELR
ncbi:hypothetical protein D0T12_03215 [Actinomadura spongiicola]|uniref:Uncharacterized protein n=1 Tax=Actinomadura spongiicola TaxID=2303421 RepID=A0A372GPE4_9ACTN|nr:hypothetical protein [Actinomadura spongiicola]RFS87261.1 hypothetical protein D0T12_03215 [Actinomadura spongiicola]